MIKKLKNKIAIQMFGDKKFLKAIAFVLLYHQKTNSNECKKYSVKKLSEITGVHQLTIKQRIETLRDRGLATVEKGKLTFLSITSKHSERNKRLDNVSYNSLADVEKSLYALLICIIQLRKEFIHRAFLDAKYSTDIKTVKKAKAMIRKYARRTKFCELGISYKRIAKKLGVSAKSAFDYVRFAVLHNFLTFENHFRRKFYKGINFYPLKGYTFSTRNYAFQVGANTYTVEGASSPLYRYINRENRNRRRSASLHYPGIYRL